MSVCQYLLRKADLKSVLNSLSDVRNDCEILQHISESHALGAHFLRILTPLYRELKDIVDQLAASNLKRQTDLMRGDPVVNQPYLLDASVLLPRLGQLVILLKMPENLSDS